MPGTKIRQEERARGAQVGHITLEVARAGHDGGAPGACRQDRQQHPCGRLKRTAAADDDVCGTPVPAGSMVAVLPYLIHRNPGRLAEPAGFDPARFLSPAPGRHR